MSRDPSPFLPLHQLFADELPLPGTDVTVFYENDDKEHVAVALGILRDIAEAGPHRFTLRTDKHPDGVRVSRLWRWAPSL